MNSEPNPVWVLENRIKDTEKMASSAVPNSVASNENLLIWKAINDLKKRQCSFGSNKVVLSTLAINATYEAQIVFNCAMPDANYVYEVLLTNPVGIALTSISVTEKSGSKTAAGLTFTIKNTGISILSGNFKLTVIAQPISE